MTPQETVIGSERKAANCPPLLSMSDIAANTSFTYLSPATDNVYSLNVTKLNAVNKSKWKGIFDILVHLL